MADFYINGKSNEDFDCRLLSSWKVGGTGIERKRLKKAGMAQGFLTMSTEYGLRKIELPLHFRGKTPEEAHKHLSEFTAEALADGDLLMPDGFWYFYSLDEISEKEEISLEGRIVECTFTFLGVAHDPLVRAEGNFHALGTAPKMAAKFSCTVAETGTNYDLAGVTFSTVTAGDVLVVDGINTKVTRNGMNAFANTDLIEFPTITPGYNTISCTDTATMEYYPIWV
jgi:phage-related protein